MTGPMSIVETEPRDIFLIKVNGVNGHNVHSKCGKPFLPYRIKKTNERVLLCGCTKVTSPEIAGWANYNPYQ